VVDGGGLENHCTRKGTGGSNPSPSARFSDRVLSISLCPLAFHPFSSGSTFVSFGSFLTQMRPVKLSVSL
jgi:hypothetical protein